MNESLMKQLIFDCAVELLHEQEGLSNEQIGERLLGIIKAHDEYVASLAINSMAVHKMKCGDCKVLFYVEDSQYRLSTDLSCPVCEDDGQVDGYGIVTINSHL